VDSGRTRRPRAPDLAVRGCQAWGRTRSFTRSRPSLAEPGPGVQRPRLSGGFAVGDPGLEPGTSSLSGRRGRCRGLSSAAISAWERTYGASSHSLDCLVLPFVAATPLPSDSSRERRAAIRRRQPASRCGTSLSSPTGAARSLGRLREGGRAGGYLALHQLKRR
jgi:hypothetical protein